MTSIICPECKSHISEYDLICLNCGYTVTQEEREKLVKEQEELTSKKLLEKGSTHQEELKHHQEFKLEKKLNKLSVGFFKVGFAEMIVPLFIILVIIIVIAIMFL